MDEHAEEAELELIEFLDSWYKKYNLRFKCTYHILSKAMNQFQLVALVKRELGGDDEVNIW